MNVINVFRKPHFAIICAFLVLFVSCTDNNNLLDNQNSTVNQYEVALNKFEDSFVEVQPLIQEFSKQKVLSKRSSEQIKSGISGNEALTKLSDPSLQLLTDYGFNDNDLEEMFGSRDTDKIKNELAGAGVLLYRLQTTRTNNGTLQSSADQPDAVGCFLEATGVAAGVALVGALTGQAGGEAVKKAFKKAVKKIGSRALGGIGLALMAAEFTWCMSR